MKPEICMQLVETDKFCEDFSAEEGNCSAEAYRIRKIGRAGAGRMKG